MQWKVATVAAAATIALLTGFTAPTTPRGGELVAQIPVSTPRDVTAGFGSIWVAGGPSSIVTRIDPATGKVTAVIAVPDPASVLAVGAGAVWVTSFPGNTVTRINPRTNKVLDTISPGGLGPVGITVFAGYVWVANHAGEPTGSVAKIDPKQRPMRIVDLIPVGHQSFAGCYPAVTRIDPTSNSVTDTIKTGGDTGALALGVGAIWYGTTTPNEIARIDPSTHAIVGKLKLRGRASGPSPQTASYGSPTRKTTASS